MRVAPLLLLIGALVLVGACADTEMPANEQIVGSAELSPEQLGEIGAQIANEPDRADQILTDRGLDRESFETAIREVTEDAEESKRYAEAFEQARG